jgi:hypothetical protein
MNHQTKHTTYEQRRNKFREQSYKNENAKMQLMRLVDTTGTEKI